MRMRLDFLNMAFEAGGMSAAQRWLGVTKGKVYDVYGGVFSDDHNKIRTESAFIWTAVTEPEEFLTEEQVASLLKEDTHEMQTFGPLGKDLDINPKAAMGAIKAPMHTVPTLASIALANVMAGGEWKYGYCNYRESQVDCLTYIGAMERHFLKWKDGVDLDKESGQHELAHLMACCAIMIDAYYTGKLIDNRSKTGLVEELLEISAEDFRKFRENNKSLEQRKSDDG